MKHYANYCLATGRLRQLYSLPDHRQPYELIGTAVIELADMIDRPEDWKVVNGQRQYSPIPPRPSEVHRWDESKGCWTASTEAAWSWVRRQRNRLLTDSDGSQASDAPAKHKAVWAQYRQQLRDITTQADPHNIVWPKKPA